MSKNVLIVESPAKAKTIEKFLGKDFVVHSSFGHIRDLDKGDGAIDIDGGYAPKYIIPDDKKKVVSTLKKAIKEAEEVWLATDEDREGEAISWHLCEVLKLDAEKTKRIVFNEITKPAIKKAVDNPRTVNANLVNAQQARRVLDRLVGFKISPILWRKVARSQSLSAGRVQSVAVRLIVEREKEIQAFEASTYYKITAQFDVKDKDGKTHLLEAEFGKRLDEAAAEDFLKSCTSASFSIADLQKKPAKKSPSPPFTTSTLQQDASRKLGFSVAKTMLVAQKLYEAGKITYMRTDSVNLSETALGAAKEEIEQRFGNNYSQTRRFKTKKKDAQEAHEAIRPTYFNQQTAGSSTDEERLYSLIWKRAIASQMADAKLEKTTASIDISTRQDQLTAKGEVLMFDGFLKVYKVATQEDENDEASGMLPPLSIGQAIDLNTMAATQRFSRPPARYTEATLVRKMEELGIGRPSTYAPTISTIQKRNYTVKESRPGKERSYTVFTLEKGTVERNTQTEITGTENHKLFPTDMGILVNDFLVQHFTNILNYDFTANIERRFDEIADGNLVWNSMIDDFYKPFHKDVENTMATAERVTGERLLGTDPKTGKPIYARLGKYGPMVQLGETPTNDEDEKPKYSKIRPPFTLSNIGLEDALALFKLPKSLGLFEDLEVKASEGRFGPYVAHNGKFVSIPKDNGVSPLTITLEQAIELIKEKRIADAKKTIKIFEQDADIQVLNGRWGPYIKAGRKNVKIPKDQVPEELTYEQCLELIKNAPAKKGRRKK